MKKGYKRIIALDSCKTYCFHQSALLSGRYYCFGLDYDDDCFSDLCHFEGFPYFHLQNSSDSFYLNLIAYYWVFCVLLVDSKQLFCNRFFFSCKSFSITIWFCCNPVLIKEFCSCKNEI